MADKKLYLVSPGSHEFFQGVCLGAVRAFAEISGFEIHVVLAQHPKDTIFERSLHELPVFVEVVKNADEFIEDRFAKKSMDSRCDVVVSSLKYLNAIMAEYADHIYVDLSKSTYGDKCLPNLHSFFGAKHDLVGEMYSQLNPEIYRLFIEKKDMSSRVALITSLFQSDEYIDGFLGNIASIRSYQEMVDHFFLFSKVTCFERNRLLEFKKNFQNTILVWFSEDPGLYQCWNKGIKLSESEYISNANVDDFRHPSQIAELINSLDTNLRASVAATAIIAFDQYFSDMSEIPSDNPWYLDEAGEFGFLNLARLNSQDGVHSLEPHNLPHCMPMWRRELHEKYGYFEENRFGTYADWAFWLKVTRAGEVGELIPQALSYYYINLESHNRRGEGLDEYHQEVEKEFIESFYYRLNVNSVKPISLSRLGNSSKVNGVDNNSKLNLQGLHQSFGDHRNSFNKLIRALLPLHTGDGGVLFIPFIERYFVWGDEKGEAGSLEPTPLTGDWIGVLHVPFDAPKWFEFRVSPESIFSTNLWRESVPTCKGIICLSKDLERDLNYYCPNIPTMSTLHPTELNVKPFDYEKYLANKRVVQAGDWLRKLQAIHRISNDDHDRVMLLKGATLKYLENEITMIGDYRDSCVDMKNMVSNAEYDEFLSSSVVLCLLYATAANNIILECIARSTPIIINPLPSVVEYLGEEYPLYASNIHDVNKILAMPEQIKSAHKYLLSLPIRRELTYDFFQNSIANSLFYKNLP